MTTRKKLTKQQRLMLWQEAARRCVYCGQEIELRDMQAERRKLRQDKLLNLYRARVTLLKCDLNTLAIEKEQQESYNITLCKQQQRLYSILRVYTRGCFGHDIEGS